MAKEKTEDEVRAEFIHRIRYMVDVWDKTDKPTTKEKLEGLAFSILAMLDGVDTGICGFIVAPATAEEDKEFHIENGQNYYPQNHNSDVKCDISGSLHDSFYQE